MTLVVSQDVWLIEQQALWSRRAPGTTCLTALKASQRMGAVAENKARAVAPWCALRHVHSSLTPLTTPPSPAA